MLDITIREMSKNINIILVDDHILFRDGLKYVLNQQEYINIVGEASDGIEFLGLLDNVVPDIVLMDISMPRMNGIEATKAALLKYPDLKIIALTMFDDDKYYYDILNAGAKGFVLKESESEKLLRAINAIVNGDSFFSNEVLTKIIRSYSNFSNTENKKELQPIIFSNREIQIIKMICKGKSNKEISEELNLNVRTIEGIRSGLLSKTQSENSLNLVLYAIENNLINE